MAGAFGKIAGSKVYEVSNVMCRNDFSGVGRAVTCYAAVLVLLAGKGMKFSICGDGIIENPVD